ncbi:MAG: hypothetical protein AAF726_00015 [Planctomycetota bacterium]
MDDADASLSTFEWTPPSAGVATPAPDESLAERLASIADDRGLGGDEVARRTARECHAWLCEEECGDDGVREALFAGLEGVAAAHGWRGPVAGLLAALGAVAEEPAGEGPERREALATECAAWTETPETIAGPEWNGALEPPALRLPDRSACAAPLLEGPLALEPGEIVVVHGWSETVARGLELARARGLAPTAIVSEGGPDLGGRRLARRLAAGGITVRFVYDAALQDAVRAADRVWIGTEAIGARGFLGRIGARALLESAGELDVQRIVLATSDKLVPGGELACPEWAANEPWHLWEGAPSGVDVQSQSYEIVPQELVDGFATELGLLRPADLAVQALRLV